MMIYLYSLVFSLYNIRFHVIFYFFFLNDTAPPEIYPLPLHDALPIWRRRRPHPPLGQGPPRRPSPHRRGLRRQPRGRGPRDTAGRAARRRGPLLRRRRAEIGRAHV